MTNNYKQNNCHNEYNWPAKINTNTDFNGMFVRFFHSMISLHFVNKLGYLSQKEEVSQRCL